jgi:tetratricopeptide (TPR) repeat protein
VITREIYGARGRDAKIIPVVFSPNDRQYIPTEFRAATYYDLSNADSYDKLFRRLTAQPARKRSVPLEENPFFTGREEVLKELKMTLYKSGMAALTGLGGIGKTQTAAQYAYRHREDYDSVLWVRAESQEALFADLVQLASRLELPERDARDQSVIVDAVKRWLDEHEKWLLVLDNVENYSVVRDLTWKATAGGRHIIITTQNQSLGVIGRQRLLPIGTEEGALLLLRRAKRLEVDAPFSAVDKTDAAVAREISAQVGGLPLALDQAGAYIDETGCKLEDYSALLQLRSKELAQKRGVPYPESPPVVAAFLISLERMARQNQAAAELLNTTAFLAPDAIPEEIFTEGAAELGPVLRAAADDPSQWNEAIGAALKVSLLERNPVERLLAVHPMVQAVAKSRMDAGECAQYAGQVVRAVNAAFPHPEFAAWDKCERLVPSAQVCAVLLDEYQLASPDAARLLNNAGLYLKQRARYEEAEPLYRRTLAVAEKSYGPDHPEVVTRLNNLAELLRATNRLDEAEPLYRRALAIDEKVLGPDHPNVGIRLNNLALVLQATNRLDEAEPLVRRVIGIFEKTYGPDHPNVATSLNNLARLLQDTNRRGEAEPLMRRALAIDEKALGPDHPDFAIDLNNLALLLQDTNRLGEAEPLMRRALAIDEKALGPDHPNVAIRLNNLALLLHDTNRRDEAEPLMRQALAIFEKSLGRDHPNAVTVRDNLAGLLRAMGKDDEADKL